MAVKCPFCGDRIESIGEATGGLVSCQTCHATVDVQLADPLPDDVGSAGAPAASSRGDAPVRPGAGSEPPAGVGSYSLRSGEMKHAKEAVFNPAASRAPAPKPVTPPAEPPRPVTVPPRPDGLRFRQMETPAAPPPPSAPPPMTNLDQMSVAYRADQFADDAGPEIPGLPEANLDMSDMNQTLDRLSGLVLDPSALSQHGGAAAMPPLAPPPPPAGFEGGDRSPGGIRLDDLDLSFDDLQPLRAAESRTIPRAAGDPGTTLDIDAVMKEESFAEALPPWAESEMPGGRSHPAAESPWGTAPNRAAERPVSPPTWDTVPSGAPSQPSRETGGSGAAESPAYSDDWARQPAPGGGAGGLPPLSDFGFGAAGGDAEGFGESLFDGAPTGALQLDIPMHPGNVAAPSAQAPAGAAPLPAARAGGKSGKSSRKSASPRKSLLRPLMLGGLLVVLVGLILGQTDYGYFGLNLLGGASGGGSAGRRAAPGTPPGLVPDRRDAWQKEVVRLQRLLVDSPKDEAVRGDLLMVLSRLRERYPAAVAADPILSAKLRELLAQVRLPGDRGDFVKAMDLMAGEKWLEAGAILDRLQGANPTDALAPYLQGKVALATDKLDDALRLFGVALARDPTMVCATYFEGVVLVKKEDLVKARATFEAVLGREAEHLPARLGLADVALASGDVEGAARMAGEVVAKAQPGADGDDLFVAHTVLARVENQKGAKDGRLRELRAALGIRPTEVSVAVEVANLLRADDKPGDALAILGPAREAGRDSAEFLAAYAQAAFADDKREVAEAAVAEGIQKHPKIATFHVLRGWHELELRRLRSAAASLETALQVDPGAVDAWVMLAHGLASEGRIGEAVKRLKEGLGKTGQSARLLVELASLQKEQHDLVSAETTLREAVTKDQANGTAQQELGLIVAAQGRMEEAAKILGDLDARRQLDRDGVLGLARALLALQQPAKAREVLQRVHDTQADDWDVAAELGRAMMEAGQDAEGETVLRKVLQQRPSHHISFFYLGQLLAKRGNKEGAIEAYESSIKANSRDVRPRIELARLFLEVGGIESVRQAKTHLDAVLAAYSRNEVVEEERDADAYLMRGRILFGEQKYSLAMKDFEAALARAPTRVDILAGFARTLFEAARYEDARPYLRQILSRDPQHPEANFLTGRILVREGKTRQARDFLERVVQRDARSFPEAHRMLGMIYRDEGMQSLARSSFQTFLRYADPKSGEAEEIRQLLARMR
jgi:tetratricopeptide (TPR) repeat protein